MPRGVRLSEGALPPEVVFDLAKILQLSDNAFIVGGQALNLWAERYSASPELAEYGPYTSKDIDYFGYLDAAKKLATALNGKVLTPDGDDHSPQTAIVVAVVDGQEIEIDFLWHVKGVDEGSLKKQAVEIRMTVRMGEREGELVVPLMHPMHCLQSRLSNVVELKRTQDLAKRQLEASPIVLREFLKERLDNGEIKHVTSVLQSLFDYLSTHMVGRKAHMVMRNDPAAILDAFQNDERLDSRWREMSLAPMRKKLADRRTALGKIKHGFKALFQK